MSRPLVEVRTADCSFTIAVCTQEAPISAGYFLSAVDSRALEGSAIFRIVTLHNQPADFPVKIAVVQMGHREDDPMIPATIPHEPTSVTGLRHRRGTVSLARFAPGAVYHSWFVCMRDEPSLDEGGARQPDGQGFAAFGEVVAGFEQLQRLFADYAHGPEYLLRPIPLHAVRRVLA